MTSTTLTLKDGIYRDLPRSDYDRIVRANWSTVKQLSRSAAHYRHVLGARDNDTDAKKVGRAVHVAIYEPHLFEKTCAVWRGGRRAGKEWDAFVAANHDRDLLTETELAFVEGMQRGARSNSAAQPYLAGGSREVTLLWTYIAANGDEIACKARLDFIGEGGAIVDLKSTRDASPTGFGRQAWNLGYCGQAAIYSDAYEAITGRRAPFVFLAVENTPPFVSQVYRVPDSVLELGREHYQGLLNQLAELRRADRWPGYADGELELTLPRWALPDEDESVEALDLLIHQGD